MMKQIDMAQMPRKELEKFAMEASGEAERLRAVVEAKEAELRLLRKEKFAGKSEKSRNDNVDEAQLSFFNDAEALARPDAEELKLEKVKPPRKPKKKGRKKEKLEKLPVKRTEYVLSEEEAVCPQCGSGLAQMKKTVRKEVEIIPAKVVVHEHITQHYVCRECEKKELHTPILQAESPKPLLAGSFLYPSMAAYVIDRKFENRDPVYKISSDFKSHALNLSDQTISNWILRTSEVYGRPLYERMWDHLLKSDYINADETTVQVLNEEGRKAQTKSYMWVFCDNHTAKPLVLFKYAASRNGDVAKKALENYKGIVQCDGYDGYNKVNGIIRTGCFTHVRRKFHEVLKAVDPKLPKEASASEREALKRCNRLFELDRKAKEQPVEKRLQWKEAFVREDMEDFSGGCKKREKILRWKANCS